MARSDEGAPVEADGVRDGQHRSHDHDGQHDSAPSERVAEGVVCVLLGDEPRAERHARHRENREKGDDLRASPSTAELRKRADVAGPGLLVDDPDHHEQGGLERRVGDEQHPPRGRRRRRSDAEEDHEQAELADGAEGQEQLEVVLTQRPQPTEDQRAAPHGDHHRSPQVGPGEDRCEPAHQDHARLHHRRRVQVRARRASARPSRPAARHGTGTAPTS